MKIDKYLEPATVDEAIKMLGSEEKPVVLAGGTDVVVRLRNRQAKTDVIVSLYGIKDLEGIKETNEGLFIGSMTKLMDVSKSEKLKGPWSVIAQGAGHISSQQVRNTGTIGGNTCNASPSADSVPGLICCDAKVRIKGSGGERSIPLEQFFKGPSVNALEKDEILLGFDLPSPDKGVGTAYKKYAIRGDTDIAIINVGAKIKINQEGTVTDAKICLGAVAPTPLISPDTADILIGKKVDEELIEAAAKKASEVCTPITDARATKEYRREMIYVWTKHVIREAVKRANQN